MQFDVPWWPLVVMFIDYRSLVRPVQDLAPAKNQRVRCKLRCANIASNSESNCENNCEHVFIAENAVWALL